MRINSVTRQSGLLAALLLMFIIVVAMSVSAVRATGAGACPRLWLDTFVSSVLMLATGMLVGRMSIKMGIFRTFCTLAIPMFGILSCGVYIDMPFANIAAVALCLAVALLLFSESLVVPGAKNPIFFGAILLGGTALLYPPCVVLVVLLPAAALISAQSLRQIIIGCVGWLLPIFAVSYVSWYGGNGFCDVAREMADKLATPQPFAAFDELPILSVTIYVIAGLLIVAGIVLRCLDRGTMLVNTRKSLQMLTIALFALAAACALPGCAVAMVPIMAVPAAVLVAYTLEKGRSDISTIIYWLLLLLLLLHLFIG